jgi:hypothetical protein
MVKPNTLDAPANPMEKTQAQKVAQDNNEKGWLE